MFTSLFFILNMHNNDKVGLLHSVSTITQILLYDFIVGIIFLMLSILDFLVNFNESLKVHMNEASDHSKIIKTTSRFLMLICDLLDQIKICFSLFSLTVQIIQNRSEILFVYALYVLVEQPTYSHFGFLLVAVTSIVLLWPASIIIIYISTRIQQEGKLTLEIIQDGIRLPTNTRNFKRLQILSQQIYHQSPVVNLSFFQIDMNFTYNYICDVFASSIFFSQYFHFMK